MVDFILNNKKVSDKPGTVHKRSRAKKSMPSRKAQKAVIGQRNLNPVLDSCG